mmetsp:Transcript_42858/g.77438  ORF Transcript_42858/g.77438 Transcript_42858/m.77438 type:complete len:232 (+) Transcript_42858:520-1215(+)
MLFTIAMRFFALSCGQYSNLSSLSRYSSPMSRDAVQWRLTLSHSPLANRLVAFFTKIGSANVKSFEAIFFWSSSTESILTVIFFASSLGIAFTRYFGSVKSFGISVVFFSSRTFWVSMTFSSCTAIFSTIRCTLNSSFFSFAKLSKSRTLCCVLTLSSDFSIVSVAESFSVYWPRTRGVNWKSRTAARSKGAARSLAIGAIQRLGASLVCGAARAQPRARQRPGLKQQQQQ